MTRTNFDQMSKQYLEEFLSPFGTVRRQYEVPGEAKFIDVWFVPDGVTGGMANGRSLTINDLGLLGQMLQKPCVFEPYRNIPSRTDVRVSVMKLVWVQEDERRKANKDELPEDDQPVLWILAATTSKPLLRAANVVTHPDFPSGVYFVADIFKTAIVAIDQLPVVPETLLLRVLGRGATQKRAIEEALALPIDRPQRKIILQLVASWKIRMDIGELVDFVEQEEIMAFTEAFLAWEQETEGKGRKEGRREGRKEGRKEGQKGERESIALNLLRQGFPLEAIAQATSLTIDQVQVLQRSL